MIKYLKYPFFLIFTIIIYFFYFHNLGYENINEDQYRWYLRSERFFTALNELNFEGTYQQYHPGVSLMYFIKLGVETYKVTNSTNFQTFKEIPYYMFPLFNFYTKFFLVSFTLISIIVLTFLIKNLYGKFISLSFLVFLTFETYFIGLTRNLHMDAFLAVSISISLVSFYLYLKTSEKKYLIISSVYSGLGLLTKSVFAIAILFQFLMTLYFAINGKISFKPFKNLIYNLLISFLIFTLFFPSMWVKPIETLSNIFIKGAYSTGLGGDDNFMHFVGNYELTDPGFEFYIYVLNFRISPMLYLTIISLIVFWVFKIYKNKKISLEKDPLIIFLALLTITYLMIIFYSSKKTDRYISIIFPPLAIITAYYLKDFWVKVQSNLFKTIFIFFTTFTMYLNFKIHPYYFAFYSPIWGGLEKAQEKIYINQGGIGYLLVVEAIKGYPDYKITAFNYDEFKYSSEKDVERIDPTKARSKKYIKILPLQRGNNLIKVGDFEKYIFLNEEPFWRIYK